MTISLSRLIAITGGGTASKQRFIISVTHFVIMYGTEIWVDILRLETYRKIKAAVQRREDLKIANSYHTVSKLAILVFVGWHDS